MTAVEETSTGPLEGLDGSQRAELELAASRWAEKRSDAVSVPVGGMVRSLARQWGVPAGPLQGRIAEAMAKGDEEKAAADQLCKDADAEAYEAAETARKANRHASYLRNRNPRYADASYGMLTKEQNPDGLVSSWLARGPNTLTMAGLARTGKTTAAYAITNDAHNRGLWTEVWTAKKIADGLRDDKAAVWARIVGCDVLLLDDLGRERVTDWWRDFLQELVDDRFGQGANGKRMIVTVNTPADQAAAYDGLIERYGDPVVERLLDHGGLVIFDGPKFRNLVTSW